MLFLHDSSLGRFKWHLIVFDAVDFEMWKPPSCVQCTSSLFFQTSSVAQPARPVQSEEALCPPPVRVESDPFAMAEVIQSDEHPASREPLCLGRLVDFWYIF